MSDSQEERVLGLIKAHGGELVRRKNHHIYRFPSGKNFVVSKTSGDCRAWHRALATLRRLLGVQRRTQKVTLAPSRKEPSPRVRPSYSMMRGFAPSSETSCSTLKSALENCLLNKTILRF